MSGKRKPITEYRIYDRGPFRTPRWAIENQKQWIVWSCRTRKEARLKVKELNKGK